MTTTKIFVFLVVIAEICCTPFIGDDARDRNMALAGIAAQSSVFDDGVAERAIDGNQKSNYAEGSCTQTALDLKPWWRVDLLSTKKIDIVAITNRRDCCDGRLDGAEIRIGNDLRDNGNSNHRCAVISAIPPGGTKTYRCFGMEGQYVNIVIPGRQEYLTLCEVEVYGKTSTDQTSTEQINITPITGINFAQFAKVAQSSLSDAGLPERAIDGNRNSIWQQSSCTHTQDDLQPWWRADLRKVVKVQYVVITNRGDCCEERLNGVEVRVGCSLNDNGNSNPRCGQSDYIPAGASKVFDCNPMEGRYVNILIPDRTEYLTLCEVEIY